VSASTATPFVRYDVDTTTQSKAIHNSGAVVPLPRISRSPRSKELPLVQKASATRAWRYNLPRGAVLPVT